MSEYKLEKPGHGEYKLRFDVVHIQDISGQAFLNAPHETDKPRHEAVEGSVPRFQVWYNCEVFISR